MPAENLDLLHRGKRIVNLDVKADPQQSGRRKTAALAIVEHGLEAGITHDVLDHLA